MKNRSRKSCLNCWAKFVPLLLLFFTFHLIFFSSAFADEIKSRAAVVMDSANGRILYAKNPDLRLLPASTTKLMTALVVVEKANLKDVVTISKRAANAAPTKAGFREGDKVTIETLLNAALIKSANDAAVALAEGVGGTEEQFVKLMNLKAIAIGANDTKFINANGLPGKGQYITAYDLSKIMRQAFKYPVLREIMRTRTTDVATEGGKSISIRNTNKLLWSDEEILGGKTGYTRQARHCFVCAGERDNETIIVAILGAPVRDLLWKESEVLLEYGAKVMSNQKDPVVYLTGNDVVTLAKNITEAPDVSRNASYAGGDKTDDDSAVKTGHGKSRTASAGKRKGVKTASSGRKGKSVVFMAKASETGPSGQSLKNSKSNRLIAKNKRLKRQRLAKKEEDGAKG